METKTTQTTATMALHPVTVPGRLLVGIFVQYQEVMPDGTLGTAKNDKFFRNPWRSERQFVGLKPGTNYLCLVTLFVNPPIPPVKSVGLPFFTLEDGKYTVPVMASYFGLHYCLPLLIFPLGYIHFLFSGCILPHRNSLSILE